MERMRRDGQKKKKRNKGCGSSLPILGEMKPSHDSRVIGIYIYTVVYRKPFYPLFFDTLPCSTLVPPPQVRLSRFNFFLPLSPYFPAAPMWARAKTSTSRMEKFTQNIRPRILYTSAIECTIAPYIILYRRARVIYI